MKDRVIKFLRSFPSRFCQWFVAVWSRIPLVGGLSEAKPKNFSECSKEFVFLWLASIAPILFGVFIEIVVNSTTIPRPMDIWDITYRNLKAGEIFIFANALLAPVAMVLYKHNRDGVKFPNHLAFLTAFYLCGALCAIVFGLQRANVIKNQSLANWLAVFIYPFAAMMRYIGLIYDAMRLDYTAATRQQENALMQSLEAFSQGKEGH